MNKKFKQIIPFAAFFLLLVLGITNPNITGNTVMSGSTLDLGLQSYGQYNWDVYLSDTYSSVGIGIYNSNDATPNKYGGWMAYVKVNGNKIWESAGNGQVYNYVTNSYETESSYNDQYFDITSYVNPGLNTIEYYHYTEGQHGPMMIVSGGTASLSPITFSETSYGFSDDNSYDYGTYDTYDSYEDSYNYGTYDSYYDSSYYQEPQVSEETQQMLDKIDEFESALYEKFNNAKNTAVLNRINVGFMMCRAKQRYDIDLESFSSTFDVTSLDKSYCDGDFQESLVQFSKDYNSIAQNDVATLDNFDLANSLIQTALEELRTQVKNSEISFDSAQADFCIGAVKDLDYMPGVTSQDIKKVDTPLSIIGRLFNFWDMEDAQKTSVTSLVWAQETVRYWSVRAYLLGGTEYAIPSEIQEVFEEWDIDLPLDPETGFAGLVYGAQRFGECTQQ